MELTNTESPWPQSANLKDERWGCGNSFGGQRMYWLGLGPYDWIRQSFYLHLRIAEELVPVVQFLTTQHIHNFDSLS
jgi:hypothetical protein